MFGKLIKLRHFVRKKCLVFQHANDVINTAINLQITKYHATVDETLFFLLIASYYYCHDVWVRILHTRIEIGFWISSFQHCQYHCIPKKTCQMEPCSIIQLRIFCDYQSCLEATKWWLLRLPNTCGIIVFDTTYWKCSPPKKSGLNGTSNALKPRTVKKLSETLSEHPNYLLQKNEDDFQFNDKNDTCFVQKVDAHTLVLGQHLPNCFCMAWTSQCEIILAHAQLTSIIRTRSIRLKFTCDEIHEPKPTHNGWWWS